MKLLTTQEVNERLLEIIRLQFELIEDLMKALGPFETFSNKLKAIKKKQKELGI